MTPFYRMLYHGMIALGRPVGGIRPRRLYDAVGRRAYPVARYEWARNRWGSELYLSHHFHLDRNILIHGDYDHELHLLFEQRVKAGMTVLDVGANLGEMALHLGRLVGEGGRVHAFEPFPPAYERLVQHVERNGLQKRVLTWPLALADKPGELAMTVPGADADNQGMGSIVNPEAAGATQTVRVQTLTLDEFVAREKVRKIDFIKLDIQGAEYLFLEGARETLRTHRPELVMEVSPTDLQGMGKTSRDLLHLLETSGYQPMAFEHRNALVPLRSASVSPTFAATNILCLPA